MKKVILQLWEVSERDNFPQQDGCSLHIDKESLAIFKKEVYDSRGDDVPEIYERVIGESIEVDVVDSIYGIIKKLKNVRLQQYEMNNFLNLKEIQLNGDI